MTKLKHTPGPWTLRRCKRRSFTKIDGDGWNGFARVVTRMELSKKDSEEGVANAKILVAALDLLHACNYTLESLLNQSVDNHTEWATEINMLKEAIKKATE